MAKKAFELRSSAYVAVHIWIKYHYGKPNHCEKCDGKNAKRFDWANISGNYFRDIKDWIQLCPSCHKLMDKGDYCKNGHKFTDENTWIRKRNDRLNSYRVCKECQRGYSRKYQNRNKNL